MACSWLARIAAQEYGSQYDNHRFRRAAVGELCSGYRRLDAEAGEGEMAKRHSLVVGSEKQHDCEVDIARMVQVKQHVSRIEDVTVVRVMVRGSKRGTELEERESDREKEVEFQRVSLVSETAHADGIR